MKSFDLEVRTEDFALGIIRLFRLLPHDDVALVIGRQVLRSGTSIGANYREAARARSNAEFIAKMGDCLKEANETGYWLNLLQRAEIVSERELIALKTECVELVAIFTASITTAKRKQD